VPNPPNREELKRTVASLEQAIADERTAKSRPPMGVAPGEEPPEPSTPPAPVVAPAPTAPPPPTHAERPTPVYKKWWLWTIVGVVVAGAAVGLGVGLGLPPEHATAKTDFGTFSF
jgi:hypothetical protein